VFLPDFLPIESWGLEWGRDRLLTIGMNRKNVLGLGALILLAAVPMGWVGGAVWSGGSNPIDQRRLAWTRDCGGCNLRGLDLRGADLRRVNLRGADLSGVNFGGANLQGADLSEATIGSQNQGDFAGRSTVFAGANLQQANLTACPSRAATFGGPI
jgi:hypothetical protein